MSVQRNTQVEVSRFNFLLKQFLSKHFYFTLLFGPLDEDLDMSAYTYFKKGRRERRIGSLRKHDVDGSENDSLAIP